METPALLGLGTSWIRWAGFQTSIKLTGNRTEIENARAKLSESNPSSESEGAGSELDSLSAIDFGFGGEVNVAFMNRYGGGGIFADANAYADYSEFGNTGIPGARAVVDQLGGGALSGSYSPLRWLHLGATQKLLYGSAKEFVLTPLNANKVSAEAADISSLGSGTGTDLATLIYLKDYDIDYSLALTIQNVVPLIFSDNAYPTFSRTINAGAGLTFHTEVNALHLSLELNDLQSASELKTHTLWK